MRNVLEVIKTLLRQNKIIDANHFLNKVENFTRIKEIQDLNNEINIFKLEISNLKNLDKIQYDNFFNKYGF